MTEKKEGNPQGSDTALKSSDLFIGGFNMLKNNCWCRSGEHVISVVCNKKEQ